MFRKILAVIIPVTCIVGWSFFSGWLWFEVFESNDLAQITNILSSGVVGIILGLVGLAIWVSGDNY
jgi:hypothetical protein